MKYECVNEKIQSLPVRPTAVRGISFLFSIVSEHRRRGWFSGNTFKANLEVHQHLAVSVLVKSGVIENTIAFASKYRRVEISLKTSVSSFMGFLKGKSSLMIYEKYPELRYKYRNREFWCRGYYVDTAGKNAKKIEEYIHRALPIYEISTGVAGGYLL